MLKAVNYSAAELTKLKAEELTIKVKNADQTNHLLDFSNNTAITDRGQFGKSDSVTLSLGVEVAGERGDNFDLTTDNVRQKLAEQPLKLHISRQKTSRYPSIGDVYGPSKDDRNYVVDPQGKIFLANHELTGQAADEATEDILAIVGDFESEVSDQTLVSSSNSRATIWPSR